MSEDHRLSRDCRRSTSLRGTCDTCGAAPTVIHLPLRLHGWFCPRHCPACSPDGHAAGRDGARPRGSRAPEPTGAVASALHAGQHAAQ